MTTFAGYDPEHNSYAIIICKQIRVKELDSLPIGYAKYNNSTHAVFVKERYVNHLLNLGLI